MTPKKRKLGPPARGGETCAVSDLGEPQYAMPVGPAKGVVRLVPADPIAVTDAGEPKPAPVALTHEDAIVELRALLREGVKSGLLAWVSEETVPSDRALVPASEEVAALPRRAREAFAARCTARAAPLRPDATSPEAVAGLLLAAARTDTPIRRQLLCLRRDFDRLARLAKEQNWTDDTPVPPDVFGPLWPRDLAPAWAATTTDASPAPPANGS